MEFNFFKLDSGLDLMQLANMFNNQLVIFVIIVLAILLIITWLALKWFKKKSVSYNNYRLNLISDTINNLSEDTKRLLFKACKGQKFSVEFSTITIRTRRELNQVKEILFESPIHVNPPYKLKKDVVRFLKSTYLNK